MRVEGKFEVEVVRERRLLLELKEEEVEISAGRCGGSSEDPCVVSCGNPAIEARTSDCRFFAGSCNFETAPWGVSAMVEPSGLEYFLLRC